MNIQEAREEYGRALKMGQKQARELTQSGRDPNPAVLDEIMPSRDRLQQVGLTEIPVDRVVGTVTSGRITAFSAGFYPLLSVDSEFGAKWIKLCAAHLSDTGIRDPIECVEYLGNFYIQEGNKRLSVLKYFGAARVPAVVKRILPPRSDSPRIQAYYEFLEFYRCTKMYDVQFTQPGRYSELLAFLGKGPGETWSERERRTFTAHYQYFRQAYDELKGRSMVLPTEEALMLWLQIHPFKELGDMTHERVKASLVALWGDLVSLSLGSPVQMQTEPARESRGNLLNRIISPGPDRLQVAFVHQRDPEHSPWIRAHEEGRQHLERVFPERVTARTYCHADTAAEAEALLDLAVEEGAQVVFTTTPQLSRATLGAAVRHPRVRFLNCSVDTPYSSVRSYYCRAYEGKFITGAIAGAMAENNRIGYIGSYPIFGVPAAINAFALGAQLTNPRARVELRWSCMEGDPVEDFIRQGIRVISNRDVPAPHEKYLEFGEYGTYCVGDQGELQPLGSPCWLWGELYENLIRSILNGGWEHNNGAVNYWWGMDSGVIDVKLARELPDGLLCLAGYLRDGIKAGAIDPFHRKILAQDGSVKNEGLAPLTPDEILHMDWLCQNVDGAIPDFSQVAPFAQSMVRQLGIYRDQIPKEKEGTL